MKLLLLCCLLIPALGHHSTNRIYRGHEAIAGQFPYQISMQMRVFNSWFHFCGGSIIDEKRILTAGHCLDDPNFSVSVGDHSLSDDDEFDERIAVDSVIRHPDYAQLGEESDALYDLGVVKLVDDIAFNDRVVKTVLADEDFDESDLHCTVSGWGTMENDQTPDILHYVTVPVLDFEKCQRKWGNMGVSVFPRTVCSQKPGPIYYGPGAGDSGGPYACPVNGTMVQIGIVSSGPNKGLFNLPAMYTRVSDYKQWILDQ